MDEEPRPMPAADQRGPANPRQIAVATDEPEKPKDHHIIPVWFFVGVILLIYGVMILASGLSELSTPPSTVLGHLHPAIWWGVLLAAIGGVYVYLYFPRRHSS